MATINPYLAFDGDCEEAFNFYKSVFGGDFMYMGKFSEMPEEYTVSDDEKNKVMHVSLPIGNKTILMGSDTSASHGSPLKKGNNFSISINVDSKDEADRLFGLLSKDGEVTMPLDNTFWGSYFGMLTDKFSIQWMVSFDTGEH